MAGDNAASSMTGQCLLHSLYHRLRSQISVEEVSSDRIDLSRIMVYIFQGVEYLWLILILKKYYKQMA